MGLPSDSSARTQTLSMDIDLLLGSAGRTRATPRSDDLELVEEAHDVRSGVPFVYYDYACLALRGGRHVDHLLAGPGGAHLAVVNPEVRHRHLVNRLRLVRHDPLER